MGKKTNWTTAEDQTLCRVWMTAGDLQLQGSDQKASNFWNVVRELFHQEIETTVERPLNGLKVRWTRINKDSQKFADIYNEMHSARLKVDGTACEDFSNAAVASLIKQQWIDEAKVAYYRYYNVKFSFEGCWKQLRYSSKWLQLLTSSSRHPSLLTNTLTTATIKEEAARAPSSSSNEEEVTATNDSVAATSAASPPTAISSLLPSPPRASIATTAAAAAVAAIGQTSTSTSAFGNPLCHKRRADAISESFTHIPSQQLQELTVTLVKELTRQNDILEDQNAISLLRVDGELLTDAEAQHAYRLLRALYLKKLRARQTFNNNSPTQ